MRFLNRQEAGRQLAQALAKYRDTDTIVYALPRGGVAVGFEVAQALGAPLELVIARKIGHPHNPEYAVCVISEEGELLCDEYERSLADRDWLKIEAASQWREALRRRAAYCGDKPRLSAKDKRAIVIDDGVATGLTMRAALRSIKKDQPKELVAAVPVAPHEVVEALRAEADRVVALEDARDYLGAVGAYYYDFPQLSDREVIAFLRHSKP